jgi:hypothetical protein
VINNPRGGGAKDLSVKTSHLQITDNTVSTHII